MKKIKALTLAFIFLLTGSEAKETPKLKPKSALVSLTRAEEAYEDKPAQVSVEGIFQVKNGKVQSIPESQTASITYQGIRSLTVFIGQYSPVSINLNASNEPLMGCITGPKAFLHATPNQWQIIKNQPDHQMTLAVSGIDIRVPTIELIAGAAEQNTWLLETAHNELQKAYQSLPPEQKEMAQCSPDEEDCQQRKAYFQELIKPDHIQPVFIEYYRLPGTSGIYSIGSFHYSTSGKSDLMVDSRMPSGFFITHFEQGKAPQLLLRDINTNGETVRSIAVLDVQGDSQPEILVNYQGYEWYYFQLYTLQTGMLKRLWQGGGGGC